MKTRTVQKSRNRNNSQWPGFHHLFPWVHCKKTLQKAGTKYSSANLTPVDQVLAKVTWLLPCPFTSSHVWTSFIHSFTWEKALQFPSSLLKPISFLESTPVLRIAKQPPSSMSPHRGAEEEGMERKWFWHVFHWCFKAYGLNALNAMEDYCHMS